MRRREFITLLGGAAAAWPLAARGQQATAHQVRVGLITPTPLTPAMLSAFRDGMHERG
jgi:putative tryptophan/tyrosine transport system substrate-binding protein